MRRSPSSGPREARTRDPVRVPACRSAGLAVLALSLAACPGTRPAGAPPCPTDRTIVLDTQEAVERFAGCTAASSVTIRTGAALRLGPLRALETITGDLVVGPTVGLEELTLRELREVGGAIHVMSNGLLRGVLLPRLERAGRVAIEANASLTTISLPRLAAVAGSLVITDDTWLELVDLSALVTVGNDLVITDNPRLALIEAPRLTRALGLRVEDNRSLPAAQVEDLRARVAPSPAETPAP